MSDQDHESATEQQQGAEVREGGGSPVTTDAVAEDVQQPESQPEATLVDAPMDDGQVTNEEPAADDAQGTPEAINDAPNPDDAGADEPPSAAEGSAVEAAHNESEEAAPSSAVDENAADESVEASAAPDAAPDVPHEQADAVIDDAAVHQEALADANSAIDVNQEEANAVDEAVEEVPPGVEDEAEAEAEANIEHEEEPAAPPQPKVYPRIVRPKKGAVKPVDPAAAVIAGSWTTTALSHDFRKTEVRTNGIDAAVKSGRVNVPHSEDAIRVADMTGDTKGMQTLYTRMLTTKQWW